MGWGRVGEREGRLFTPHYPGVKKRMLENFSSNKAQNDLDAMGHPDPVMKVLAIQKELSSRFAAFEAKFQSGVPLSKLGVCDDQNV